VTNSVDFGGLIIPHRYVYTVEMKCLALKYCFTVTVKKKINTFWKVQSRFVT